MRLHRFFTERTNLVKNSSVLLRKQDYTHIRKVLRLKPEDKIILFNGEKEFLAKLKIVGKDLITAQILEVTRKESFDVKDKIELYLFQALPKAGKMDLIVEKTVEIGVDKIIPFDSEYSQNDLEKSIKKLDRWTRIAISAAKQCNRITVPTILPAIKFSEILKYQKDLDVLIMFTINNDIPKQNLKEILKKTKYTKGNLGFIIGPEGGFSPEETQQALHSGIQLCQVFANVLKTETAAISITSLIKYFTDEITKS